MLVEIFRFKMFFKFHVNFTGLEIIRCDVIVVEHFVVDETILYTCKEFKDCLYAANSFTLFSSMIPRTKI